MSEVLSAAVCVGPQDKPVPQWALGQASRPPGFSSCVSSALTHVFLTPPSRCGASSAGVAPSLRPQSVPLYPEFSVTQQHRQSCLDEGRLASQLPHLLTQRLPMAHCLFITWKHMFYL